MWLNSKQREFWSAFLRRTETTTPSKKTMAISSENATTSANLSWLSHHSSLPWNNELVNKAKAVTSLRLDCISNHQPHKIIQNVTASDDMSVLVTAPLCDFRKVAWQLHTVLTWMVWDKKQIGNGCLNLFEQKGPNRHWHFCVTGRSFTAGHQSVSAAP